MHLLDRLCNETRELQADADGELRDLVAAPTAERYRRYLCRLLGFVRPLEGSVWETPHLARFVDLRRLRRHPLLVGDLERLGMTRGELGALPRCTSVPWFETVQEALGWAFVVERSTLFVPSVLSDIASAIPREIEIAGRYLSSFLDPGAVMWGAFTSALEVAIEEPHHVNRIVDGAKAGFRHLRRWRTTLDSREPSAEPRAFAIP